MERPSESNESEKFRKNKIKHLNVLFLFYIIVTVTCNCNKGVKKMYYTAIEMQKKLEEKYPNQITVRQIRTYSQQEMISPPIRVDGKLKYEEKHLNELETIINLRLKGKKSEEIKGSLRKSLKRRRRKRIILSLQIREKKSLRRKNLRLFSVLRMRSSRVNLDKRLILPRPEESLT